MPVDIDHTAFIASLGGRGAVGGMSHEARADALEDYAIHTLDEAVAQIQARLNNGRPTPVRLPTAAEVEAHIDGSPNRRGVGNLFVPSATRPIGRLEAMPKRPTLADFFKLRFEPANHVLQSATRAMTTGMTEEVILAC